MSEKKQPAYKTQHGGVSAAVWSNEGKENSTFHTLTFDRSYKDGEEFKSTSSYNLENDLNNLERCIFDVKVWNATRNQK